MELNCLRVVYIQFSYNITILLLTLRWSNLRWWVAKLIFMSYTQWKLLLYWVVHNLMYCVNYSPTFFGWFWLESKTIFASFSVSRSQFIGFVRFQHHFSTGNAMVLHSFKKINLKLDWGNWSHNFTSIPETVETYMESFIVVRTLFQSSR